MIPTLRIRDVERIVVDRALLAVAGEGRLHEVVRRDDQTRAVDDREFRVGEGITRVGPDGGDAGVPDALFERVRGGNVLERLKLIPRAMFGMMVAHVGIAVFIIGVTMVKGHEVERDVKMEVGDSTTVRDVTFTFKGVSEVQGPNYVEARGSIEVSRDGRVLREMNPEKRMYRVQTNPMTEAAIATGLTGDLYVSLGEPVEGSSGAWIVRVYVKPFVDWIWGGCVLMALGGLLAMLDRRYRVRSRAAATVPAGSQQA